MTLKRFLRGPSKAGYTAALCSLATLLIAQTQIPPDEFTLRAAPYSPLSATAIRTQAELVEVPVVVRDGKGTVVRDLKCGDFEVFDSRKKRKSQPSPWKPSCGTARPKPRACGWPRFRRPRRRRRGLTGKVTMVSRIIQLN
jgi:hypothetical protein